MLTVPSCVAESQTFVYCKDCKLFCCLSCSVHCHQNHEQTQPTVVNNFCECAFQTGSSAFSAPCLTMDQYWLHVHTNFANFLDYCYVPRDISKIIIGFLSGKDLLKLQLVNSALYMALNTKEAQEIWKMRLRRDFKWNIQPRLTRTQRKALQRLKAQFAHKPVSKTWRVWYIRRLNAVDRFSSNFSFVRSLTLV